MKKVNISSRKFKVVEKNDSRKNKSNLWEVMNIWFAMTQNGRI